MYILGINSAYHESSACLLHNGAIVAAAEEERFTRRKHGKSARVDNPQELPENAIAYCLARAGIGLHEVRHIGFSLFPTRRLQNRWLEDSVVDGDWGSVSGEETFYALVNQVPQKLRKAGFTGEFSWLDHHICHAASAFYVSPFQTAAILVVDGIGEIASTLLAYGEDKTISVLQETMYPSSLGFLWEKMSKYLGFSEYDATKIMGLAAYGDPTVYRKQFERLVTILPDGQFSLDNTLLQFRVEDSSRLEMLFQCPKREKDQKLWQAHKDIAAALQEITNQTLLHVATYLHTQTQVPNLCLAGGVALNCTTNRVLYENGLFSNLYIQPAAHDAGTALGAALLLSNSLADAPRNAVMSHAYLGPAFSDEEIESVLQERRVNYRRVGQIEKVVAELLSQQKIVGWFQGGMEFGPRALGNRSLLADPRDGNMREILNRKIKHREPFRPFAPSVLEEEVDTWFIRSKYTYASDFMLLAYQVKEHLRERIPAVIHIDGTSRIQVVRRETNERYYQLIAEFFRLTGIPLVLNTSFNDDEPIVCTPHDALETFQKTGMDYLAIGNYLVTREN